MCDVHLVKIFMHHLLPVLLFVYIKLVVKILVLMRTLEILWMYFIIMSYMICQVMY